MSKYITIPHETGHTLRCGSYEGWEIDYLTGENFFLAYKEIKESSRPFIKEVQEDFNYMETLISEKKKSLWKQYKRELRKEYQDNKFYTLGEKRANSKKKELTIYITKNI